MVITSFLFKIKEELKELSNDKNKHQLNMNKISKIIVKQKKQKLNYKSMAYENKQNLNWFR